MFSARCVHKEIKSGRKKRVGHAVGNRVKPGHNLNC